MEQVAGWCVVVGAEAAEAGEEVVEGGGQAGHAAFAGLAGIVAEVGGAGGDLEDGLVGALEGSREGDDLVDFRAGVALDVSGDDQAAHGVADQGDGGMLAEGGVVAVVADEEGAVDYFVDEGGQALLGVVEGHAPVVAEGEDGHGRAAVVGEAVAEFLDQVLVDQGEGAAGCDAGGLLEFVALVLGVEGDAFVAALERGGPHGFGGHFVFVVQDRCGDAGHEDDRRDGVGHLVTTPPPVPFVHVGGAAVRGQGDSDARGDPGVPAHSIARGATSATEKPHVHSGIRVRKHDP